jgi:O-antigen/teichoic acid export membrane protein
MTIGKKIAVNSFWNFTGYGLSIVLSLLATPFIINRIGIDSLGIYALLVAILAPLDLANLGFGEATIKYVAQYAQSNNWEKVNEYISTTFLMNLIVGIIGMLILIFFGPYICYSILDIKESEKEVIRTCFYLISAGWIIRQCTAVFLAIPPALQNYKYLSIGNFVTSLISTLLSIGFVYYHSTIVGYTMGTVAGGLFTLIFWFAVSKKLFPDLSIYPKLYKSVWKESFRYGGWQTLASIGSLLTNQSDKYVIGAYLQATALGVYNVVFQIEQKILSAIWKIAEVLFPAFSAISHQDDKAKFELFIKATWTLSVIGVLVFLPLLPLSQSILSLWISSDFAQQGNWIFKSLMLVGALASLTVVQIFFLMGNGNVKALTFISYLTGLLTLGCTFIFIPFLGLNGAGIGLALAALLRLIPLYFIFRKIFGSHFSPTAYLTCSIMPLFIGGICILPFTIWRDPIFESWVGIFIFYALLCVFLAVLILLLNFSMSITKTYNKEVIASMKMFANTLFNRNIT